MPKAHDQSMRNKGYLEGQYLKEKYGNLMGNVKGMPMAIERRYGNCEVSFQEKPR
jgi:hypothetical protein